MAKVQIDTMADYSEIVHYDTAGIPIYIRKGILSDYPGKRAVCHWHDDIEMILVLDGKMNYYINGKIIVLEKNCGVIINTREMHYGYAVKDEDCIFICILFHPSLLSSCKKIFEEYVTPLLEKTSFSYLHLYLPEHAKLLEHIHNIWALKNSENKYDILNIIGLIYSLWDSVNKCCESLNGDNIDRKKLSSDVIALRQMVSFIHEHYREELSLQEIANTANVCKSKCCKIFKNQVEQSPIDFLNTYRLHVSAELLKTTSMSISDIALECGFNHLSYYSKLFLRTYECTPSEYRK